MRLHHGRPYVFFVRQLIYVGLGVLTAGFFAWMDYHVWKNHRLLTGLFYGVVFVLLLLVLKWFGGKPVNGSYRWLDCGVVNLQPSEFAKLAIVIATAAWMDAQSWKVESFLRGAVVPFALIALFAVPILAETDLGSTMVVGAAGLLIMLIGGTRLRYLGLAFALIGVGFLGVMLTNENRLRRLLAWLPDSVGAPLANFAGVPPAVQVTSTAQMDAAAYQGWNSLVAIANGGIGGVGLGNSMQKHFYLPEAHTDFVFAVGAEELGIGFTVGVIVLFCLFFALSIYIARKANDRFGRMLVIGMAFIIFFQAMFNLGVVCEALPTKGMALPFFSYGGTNMISAGIAIGTILSVGIHSYREKKNQFLRKVLVSRR